MRVPLSWLSEFVPLRADARNRASVEELRATLDSLGLVVEEIEYVGAGLEDVVLARVVDIQPIEKADRIRHITVDFGSGESLAIVCGAWNFDVGDVVPLAPVGTTLPNGMTIATRKMRGVTSNGMLCSGRELGLSEDSSGLMVLASSLDGALPGNMSLGMSLVDYLGIDIDAVFDISVEPNRPDCLSMIGIARDVAARLGLPFEPPRPAVNEDGPSIDGLASLRVGVPEDCPRMLVRVIENVQVFPSSRAMAQRLTLAGMRPINAIVDVSNYVMLELGQPTHPYDLDRLSGHGLSVRRARRGETLTTLDGQVRLLGESLDAFGHPIEAHDLLICDAEDHPVGLAGVMGGAETEISESTMRVCLEIADFEPLVVGRLAARLNLRSEASTRFWRGIDSGGLHRAADRYCELLTEQCAEAGIPAPRIANGVLDSAPGELVRPQLLVRTERVNAVLGTALCRDEIAAHLEAIEFVVKADGENLVVEVPSFRPDIVREVDVAEEVARQFGFENITKTVRRSPFVGRLNRTQRLRRSLRSLLTGLGAHEALSSSLVDAEREPRDEATASIVVTNPISPKEHSLRRSMLPGLLGAVAHNNAHRNGSIRLFEFGHVFAASPVAGDPPVEREHCGMVFADDGDDAASALGAWWSLVEGLGIDRDAVSLRQPSLEGSASSQSLAAGVHPSRLGLIEAFANATAVPVGAIGEVDPHFAASFGLVGRRIGWLVVDVDALFGLPARDAAMQPYSTYPSSDFDLDFVLGEDIAADQLLAVLERAAGEVCESIRLVDVYRGPSLPNGTRSVTYRLRLCALDHTLNDEEVTSVRVACIAAATAEFGATLRG